MTSTVSSKIEKFFATYKLRTYSKGQILILNGDDTDFVYYLVKGRVKVYDVTYRGEEIILNIYKPSAFFPMSLAINKAPNPYIYEAETDIQLRQVPAKEAVEFIIAHPEVMFDLLGRVYKGVDGLMGRLVQLMAGTAKSRLLYELTVECKRFGKKQKDGRYLLEITESEIASRTGLSRETVSREMHKIKVEKLALMVADGIIIPDIEALELKITRLN